jgi:hypothetical protein
MPTAAAKELPVAAAVETAAVADDDSCLDECVCTCRPCDAEERALLEPARATLLLTPGAADTGRDIAETEDALLPRALLVPALAVLAGRCERAFAVPPTATLPCRTGRCAELLEVRDADELAFCLPEGASGLGAAPCCLLLLLLLPELERDASCGFWGAASADLLIKNLSIAHLGVLHVNPECDRLCSSSTRAQEGKFTVARSNLHCA